MFKSLFKVLIFVALISLAFFAYQINGYVEFRFGGVSSKLSVGQFVVSFFIVLIILFYLTTFVRYVAGFSSFLRTHWKARKEKEAERNLKESISLVDAELYQDAFRKVKKAKEVLKETGFASWAYARLTHLMGSIDDAVVSRLVEDRAFALSGCRLKVERFMRQGNYQSAIEFANVALKTAPSSPWFLNIVFKLYLRSSEPRQALDVAKKMNSYGLPSANHKMALCYFLISQLEEGAEKQIKPLEKAVALDKSSGNIVAELVKCYISCGKHKKAQELIESVWAHTRSSLLGGLFLQSVAQKNSDEKVEAALGLLNAVPASIEGYIVVVRACLDAQFLQKARYYLEKAIQANKGMSFQLLDLRVRITQADSAEKMDIYSWLQQAHKKTLVEFWECDNCGFRSDVWSETCMQCKEVDSYLWKGEHEVAQTFYAIQKE